MWYNEMNTVIKIEIYIYIWLKLYLQHSIEWESRV